MAYPLIANIVPLPKGKEVPAKPEGWHSKLSPSGLKANSLCAGRYFANKDLPKSGSSY